MRGAEKPHMGVIGPAPAREEHARQQALGEARRHVNQQAVNLAVKNGLQMVADGLHVPPPHQRITRLYDLPSLADELSQITLAFPPALPQVQFGRYRRYR